MDNFFKMFITTKQPPDMKSPTRSPHFLPVSCPSGSSLLRPGARARGNRRRARGRLLLALDLRQDLEIGHGGDHPNGKISTWNMGFIGRYIYVCVWYIYIYISSGKLTGLNGAFLVIYIIYLLVNWQFVENHYFSEVTHVPTHRPCSMANCELNLWEIWV